MHSRIHRWLTLGMVFFSLSVPISVSFGTEALTWENSVKEALKNHPDLVSAREKVNQSVASKNSTAANLLPQVSGEARAGAAALARSSSRTDTYSYGVTASQLVFDGFKTYFDVEQAARNVDADRFNYDVTSSNVRLRLRTAFVSLLTAQEALTLTENIAARRKQNEEMINLRYQAGREHKGSLLTAQANLAQAYFDIEQSKRAIALNQRQVTKELGRVKMIPVQADGSLEVRDTVFERPDFGGLSVSTPFLQALVVQKEAAKWGVKSAIASFLPQVYANASADKTDSSWPPKSDGWAAGLTLSIPLFEGGSLVAQAEKSKSQLRQAEAEERSGRDGVILTLEQTWKQWQDALGAAAVQKKFLEANQERANIAEAQYSAGLISFNDWTIIEDNLVSTQKAYLNARANVLITQAAWSQAKGDTLDA